MAQSVKTLALSGAVSCRTPSLFTYRHCLSEPFTLYRTYVLYQLAHVLIQSIISPQ